MSQSKAPYIVQFTMWQYYIWKTSFEFGVDENKEERKTEIKMWNRSYITLSLLYWYATKPCLKFSSKLIIRSSEMYSNIFQKPVLELLGHRRFDPHLLSWSLHLQHHFTPHPFLGRYNLTPHFIWYNSNIGGTDLALICGRNKSILTKHVNSVPR